MTTQSLTKGNKQSADVDIEVIKEECPSLIGYVNVNADGTIADICGDITVTRTAVGVYTLTPPVGAETVSLDVIEVLGTRDSIEIHPIDFLGTTVHISEGDNGTAANNLRDRSFSAKWYGKKEFVTDVITDSCETFEDIIANRPLPNTGWNNQLNTTGNFDTDDSELCFTIDSSTGASPQMLGLNSDPNSNASYTSIDYSFYVYDNGTTKLLQIRENGAFRLTVPGAWAVGDELCIRRDINTGVVTYYKNGILVYTSTVLSTAPLAFDNSFYFAAGFWGTGQITFTGLKLC